MSEHTPIILIELVVVFGGAIAFAWWQLRDVKRAQEETRRRRALDEADGSSGPEAPRD